MSYYSIRMEKLPHGKNHVCYLQLLLHFNILIFEENNPQPHVGSSIEWVLYEIVDLILVLASRKKITNLKNIYHERENTTK